MTSRRLVNLSHKAFGKVGQRIKNLFKGLGKVVPKFITKTGFDVKSVTSGCQKLRKGTNRKHQRFSTQVLIKRIYRN